jgi:hypothetical protein
MGCYELYKTEEFIPSQKKAAILHQLIAAPWNVEPIFLF